MDTLRIIIKKKDHADFTIISFSDNRRIYTINERGTYDWGIFKYRTLKFFKDNKIPVYSIYRTSDSRIFTIGDIARFPGAGKLEITEILSNGIILHKEISRYIVVME